MSSLISVRLDKWLWAARFYKTRSLATHEIELGRILCNEQKTKPAHALKVGDLLCIHKEQQVWEVEVLRLLEVRGSASIAQTMYAETAQSLQKRQQLAELRRFQTEPGAAFKERPSKRQRRQLDALRFEESS
ncbi:MAG: RNA-binding S4 domain-containing protein [Burkholderiales bacterium]|nr:RNA-binding S4 domain-containing protein [Burkholderiales bacterium]